MYLDALHCDVVDHPDNTAGSGYSQQGMTRVGVVGPGTRVKVLISLLHKFSQRNRYKKSQMLQPLSCERISPQFKSFMG